ncbi:MAG: group III truncated hemoglobin [Ottowia sp.]|nr:group III truncated hemoglobin [Ottowia sp.]
MTAQPDPVSRPQVRALIDAFYADVREDALLAPVFARFLRRDWPDHLALMTDFWCTALKLERSFRGDVYGRHVALTGVTRDHLLRWLCLWRKHSLRHLPRAQAERVQGVAVGMARVLHLGWFGSLPSRQALCAEVRAAAAEPARVIC